MTGGSLGIKCGLLVFMSKDSSLITIMILLNRPPKDTQPDKTSQSTNMHNLWIIALVLSSSSLINAVPSSRGGYNSPKSSLENDSRKVCLVKCEGKGQDDSKNILEAVHECNNGGRVVFEKNNECTIGTALDLTFLNNIEIS